MQRNLYSFIAIILALTFHSCSTQSTENTKGNTPAIKNVIFIIGDGMGLNQVCGIQGENNFERSHFVGLSKTYSASHRITDSAASGTAIASGIKTNNGMLGIEPDSTTLTESILIPLRKKGLTTALAATSEMTHATPAAYYAHQINRGMDSLIINDFYKFGPDIYVGGGSNHINKDSLNKYGYVLTNDYNDLKNINKGKVICALAEKQMQIAPKRGDNFINAIQEALLLANKNEKGFFFMIEESQIDWACHGNNKDELIAEMNEINTLVKNCFDFADKNPGTLVIITADHETGGVSLSGDENIYKFSTGGHTGAMIPVYSYGTGAENFSGIFDNTEFKGKILNLFSDK